MSNSLSMRLACFVLLACTLFARIVNSDVIGSNDANDEDLRDDASENPIRSIPGIQGIDDRLLTSGTDYPWGAIGRVNNTLGPYCTGMLVGPRSVLTAAHCLWNQRTGNWLPACALHFLAGYRKDRFLAHSLVVSYQLAGGKSQRLLGQQNNPVDDWAILTLAEDLSATVDPLPTLSLDSKLAIEFQHNGLFVQAGYSRDRPHILTFHRPCRITSFAYGGLVALHECDATYGDSGSPILLERDFNYHVVAMLIGIDKQSGKGIAVTGKSFHEPLKSMINPVPNEKVFTSC